MSFRIRGLQPAIFDPYFKMNSAQLSAAGAVRLIAGGPDIPCRISLSHAPVGDEVLLLNYEHMPANTPYRSRHAIYVSRSAAHAFDEIDVVPEVILARLVSVRAFDGTHNMIDAEVVEGVQAASLFEKMLKDRRVACLHVHNARRGCYSAMVERP